MGMGNEMGIPFRWESYGNGKCCSAVNGNGNGRGKKSMEGENDIFCQFPIALNATASDRKSA